jgi:hypothetical protein
MIRSAIRANDKQSLEEAPALKGLPQKPNRPRYMLSSLAKEVGHHGRYKIGNLAWRKTYKRTASGSVFGRACKSGALFRSVGSRNRWPTDPVGAKVSPAHGWRVKAVNQQPGSRQEALHEVNKSLNTQEGKRLMRYIKHAGLARPYPFVSLRLFNWFSVNQQSTYIEPIFFHIFTISPIH